MGREDEVKKGRRAFAVEAILARPVLEEPLLFLVLLGRL